MAASLGLDQDRFEKVLRSADVRQRVAKDAAAAKEAKIASTPTFFIDGRRLETAPSTAEDFMKLIDAAVAVENRKP